MENRISKQWVDHVDGCDLFTLHGLVCHRRRVDECVDSVERMRPNDVWERGAGVIFHVLDKCKGLIASGQVRACPLVVL